MAVRNQHVRQSRRYVERVIDGQAVHFYPYDWEVNKSKLYSVSRRAQAGRLTLPSDTAVHYGIAIVYVRKDGTLSPKEA